MQRLDKNFWEKELCGVLKRDLFTSNKIKSAEEIDPCIFTRIVSSFVLTITRLFINKLNPEATYYEYHVKLIPITVYSQSYAVKKSVIYKFTTTYRD